MISGTADAALVIGVAYRSDEMAMRFAASGGHLIGRETCTLVIVDNTEGGNRGLARRLGAVNPPVTYVRAPENLGYLGAAAYALSRYLEDHGLPAWVVVSNVDVEFADRDFLVNLASGNWPDDIAARAPSIISSETLGDLNPFMLRRPHRLVVRWRRAVFSNVYTLNAYEIGSALKHALTRLLRRVRLPIGTGGRPRRQFGASAGREIYAAHGSCIVLARKYFERGGGLVYPLFLYGEEVFVAETARRLQLRVVYDPSLRLRHDEHTSTGLIRSRRIAAHVGKAHAYLADRYFQ